MSASYVKFYRGTLEAFNNLSTKNSDTLYFINDVNGKEGQLYLGDKLIVGKVSSVKDLEDFLLNNVSDKDLLTYDKNQEKWINKSVIDAIGLMQPALDGAQGKAGLVPAPTIGGQNLFLRGDGVWAMPTIEGEAVEIVPDEKTISLLSDGITIALKDFGVKYYKYVPAQENVNAHYEAQIVDESHPWKDGLEAKVTTNDSGEFILGWFEKDLSLDRAVDTLNSQINDLSTLVNSHDTAIGTINTSVTNIAELLNSKADKNDVYTKEEIDQKTFNSEALIRKTFNSLDEAKTFANSTEKPEAYIYMVLSGELVNNKYTEYLYIEGELESIGVWEANVNLDDYAKKADLENLNTKVVNLESLLNNKADKTEVEAVSTEVSSVKTQLTNLNTKVTNLETLLNTNFITKEEHEADLDEIRAAITWQEL